MSVSPSNLRIGIVGAGHMGEPLARLLTQAGHTVKIANSRGAHTLTEVAQRTGASAATVQEAVTGAELVVVSVLPGRVSELDRKLFSGLPADTILVDTCNYYPARDGIIDELESDGAVESRWLERQLGHAVVKAFNNIFYGSLDQLGKPAATADRIALPVAGDNATHKATVMALVDQIGFDAVDAGGLDGSWRQQPGTPVYGTDWDVKGVLRTLGQADQIRSHKVRELHTVGLFAAMAAGKSNEQISAIARELMAQQYGL